jgi:hypothetical protein
MNGRPGDSAPRLYVDSLNSMIDQQEVRLAGLNNRVPNAVLWLELLGAAIALGLLGLYQSVLGRGLIPIIAAAFVVSLLVLVTFDLDRPTRGLIKIPSTPLLAEKETMSLPPRRLCPTEPGRLSRRALGLRGRISHGGDSEAVARRRTSRRGFGDDDPARLPVWMRRRRCDSCSAARSCGDARRDPAKHGAENAKQRRTEKCLFGSWEEITPAQCSGSSCSAPRCLVEPSYFGSGLLALRRTSKNSRRAKVRVSIHLAKIFCNRYQRYFKLLQDEPVSIVE